jgi:tRNA nucleotidyltransferase (CCA-adding enzyme)
MPTDVRHLLDLVPGDVLEICSRLREKGKRGWIVGGCVRDLLRERPAKDWDVCTDARPEEVVSFFRKVIPTGIQHGTVTVVVRGVHYEVTTLRGEGAYSDGRRPDKVEFVDDITADLARRDFTFNAMAIDPLDGHLIDPFGGEQDLKARVLRAVGDAAERFFEDGLRVLRAARFAATLECSIDPETERAMGAPRSLDTFRRVSAERVRDEWLKAMTAARPSVAFEAMRRTAILDITCPELTALIGKSPGDSDSADAYQRALATVDACKPAPLLRVAALLHDVGKPRLAASGTPAITFPDHARLGAEMAEVILARLKLSNDERARVAALVRHHVIGYSTGWTDASVRRWIRRVTVDLAPDLYELASAIARSKGGDVSAELAAIEELRARATALVAAGAALSTRDLALNGRDLMAALGVPPSRIIGETLERLLELVTDDPAANERETLLAAARALLAEPALKGG